MICPSKIRVLFPRRTSRLSSCQALSQMPCSFSSGKINGVQSNHPTDQITLIIWLQKALMSDIIVLLKIMLPKKKKRNSALHGDCRVCVYVSVCMWEYMYLGKGDGGIWHCLKSWQGPRSRMMLFVLRGKHSSSRIQRMSSFSQVGDATDVAAYPGRWPAKGILLSWWNMFLHGCL